MANYEDAGKHHRAASHQAQRKNKHEHNEITNKRRKNQQTDQQNPPEDLMQETKQGKKNQIKGSILQCCQIF